MEFPCYYFDMKQKDMPRKLPVISPLPDNIQNLSHIKRQNFIQSNPLVEAIFIQPFKEFELKVLCLISKYINEKKYEVKNLEDAIETYMKVTIKKGEFCEILKTNPFNFYRQMHSLAEEITNKKIKIKNPQNNNFDVIVLFPCVRFKDGNAIFYMSYLLSPYLQHLRNNFTVSNLEYITNMGSAYAIRLYQLLNQYKSIGRRTFKIEELKHLLGINNKYLDNFKHFKREVLLISQKHINTNTDLKIKFSSIKEGRIVKAIEFSIEEKENQFQKAIKQFQTETDTIFTSELYKKNLSKEHKCEIFQKTWNQINKDTTNDIISKFFEIWIQKRLQSYKPASFEELQLLAKEEETIPEWYALGIKTIDSN
jgi:plasmid replication initiation protein